MRVPSRSDALILLEEHQGTKPDRMAHSMAVAELAVNLAKALNANGLGLVWPLSKRRPSCTTSARASRTTTGPEGSCCDHWGIRGSPP